MSQEPLEDILWLKRSTGARWLIVTLAVSLLSTVLMTFRDYGIKEEQIQKVSLYADVPTAWVIQIAGIYFLSSLVGIGLVSGLGILLYKALNRT
jgi:uncharacterized membrane protein YbhN (UPF0104 family)